MMTFHTTRASLKQLVAEKADVRLPLGLIGLPRLTSFELITDPEIHPFFILRHSGTEEMDFLVVDSSTVLNDYHLEVSDADAQELGLSATGDSPLVLNVAIIHSTEPPKITANLMAPLLFNRKSGLGKQILLENSAVYSSEHQLAVATL